MTVVSSREGKFYEVPDDVLKKHEVPAEQVEQILASFDSEAGGSRTRRPITIYVTGSGAYVEPRDGEVEPYGYGWGWHTPYYYHYPYRRRRRHHYYYDHYGY